LRDAGFVHLHVYSEYSSRGLSGVEALVNTARSRGMTAMALTDEAMYGAVPFYRAALDAGIKPILGTRVDVYPPTGKGGSFILASSYPLILLARNLEGYRNLCSLSTMVHFLGNNGSISPRPLLWSELSAHAKGLVALGGEEGEIVCLLAAGDREGAILSAKRHRELFGEHFYVELPPALIDNPDKLKVMVEMSRAEGIPLVASAPVFYARPEEAGLYRLVLAARNNKPLKAIHLPIAGSGPHHLASPAEMRRIFQPVPEAVENTLKVAESCNLELTPGKPSFPCPPLAEGDTPEGMLARLAREGASYIYHPLTSRVEERLNYELETINRLGLAPYFLLVWDLVRYARKKDITVGPGRGSVGGSLVAYCLGITEVDPLRYGLMFERFLNPERKELPDIDIDVCQRRRQELLDYLQRTYGHEHVSHIATFPSFGARGAVRAAGKALGLPSSLVDGVARLLPQYSGKGGIEHALRTLPEFRWKGWGQKDLKNLLEAAISLEGIVRTVAAHAGGLAVSLSPLTTKVPLTRDARGRPMCQYDLHSLGYLGLAKLDVLGLRNLTIVQDTVSLLKERGKVDLNPAAVQENDRSTMALIQRGETLGCFQLESTGMRNLLSKVRPKSMEDLVAVLSLYRPGPWDPGSLRSFLNRKQGLELPNYIHPSLEPILRDTCGIILYQEQVMEIAREVGGMSMGQADLFRKALASPDPRRREAFARTFIEGAIKRGFKEREAREIYGMLRRFGGYSFNKAHSAAYARISYLTAYLKAHYPTHYFSALLSSGTGYYSPRVYFQELKERGIPLLPPDVNRSSFLYLPEKKGIRMGLLNIKGIGPGAALAIIKAREEGEDFSSLEDFRKRVRGRVGSRILLHLLLAGALDSLGDRKQMLDKVLGPDQPVLFGEKLASWQQALLPVVPDEEPLETGFKSTASLKTSPAGAKVQVGGVVVSSRRQPNHSGEYSLILLLQDHDGLAELILRPQIYRRYVQEIDPRGIVAWGITGCPSPVPRVMVEKIKARRLL